MASVDRVLVGPSAALGPEKAEAPLLGFGLDAFFHSYSQVLLSRSRLVGAVLLTTTLLDVRAFFAGVLAVLLALGISVAIRFDRDLIRSGLFGYGPLLLGLGGASTIDWTDVSAGTLVVTLAVGVLVTVLLTAALHSFMWGTMNLPVLTVPFLLSFHLLYSALPLLGMRPALMGPDPWSSQAFPELVVNGLHSLGALFFLPRVDAGLLVLVALLISSRVGTLLAAFGFALSVALGPWMGASVDHQLPVIVGYNFMLVGIALGGVWFVPSPSSFFLAAAGVLAGGLVTAGLLPLLARGGLPLLVLPFNLVVLSMLAAMRQRTEDRAPKAVDFLLGSPEENLRFFRTRLARFGAHYFMRLRAPFLGRWVCTQGVDGDLSHQGAWKHAFDFEVADAEGKLHRGRGDRATDYLCYRLPVLAVAEGRVVKVVDGVKDNRVGEVNLEQNWGNLVIIEHARMLYSMVCHLSPGTLKVREGQFVTQGEQLGLCGASGRADVPHLHFQLQASPRVGAPTIPIELHDVVRVEGSEETLVGTLEVQEGQTVRNLAPDDFTDKLLGLVYGHPLTFTLESGRTETVTPDLDAWGNFLVRSRERGAVLYYQRAPGLFTVFDVVGAKKSVLHLIQAALGRLPFEATDVEIAWSDHLPRSLVLPWWGSLLLDFIAPFTHADGLSMHYRARTEDRRMVVEGQSVEDNGGQGTLISTRAVLVPGHGIESISVEVRGRKTTIVRRPEADQEKGAPDLETTQSSSLKRPQALRGAA